MPTLHGASRGRKGLWRIVGSNARALEGLNGPGVADGNAQGLEKEPTELCAPSCIHVDRIAQAAVLRLAEIGWRQGISVVAEDQAVSAGNDP